MRNEELEKIHIEERRSIDGDNMLDCCEYQLDEKGCKKIPVYPHRFRYFIVFCGVTIRKPGVRTTNKHRRAQHQRH